MLCTFEPTVWELEQQRENVAFHKKDDAGWNAVVMKQQDSIFTQMTTEVAITAIFQGLGYTPDDWGTGGFIRCSRKSFFSSAKCPNQIWGATQHPIPWVLDVKQPGYEADHLPPFSAKVNPMAPELSAHSDLQKTGF
jgi:hypothetical protein